MFKHLLHCAAILTLMASCDYAGKELLEISSNLSVVKSVDCSCPTLLQEVDSYYVQEILYRNVYSIRGNQDVFELCYLEAENIKRCVTVGKDSMSNNYVEIQNKNIKLDNIEFNQQFEP